MTTKKNSLKTVCFGRRFFAFKNSKALLKIIFAEYLKLVVKTASGVLNRTCI